MKKINKYQDRDMKLRKIFLKNVPKIGTVKRKTLQEISIRMNTVLYM